MSEQNNQTFIASEELEVIIFCSIQFLHEKINQTNIISFKNLKSKPIQTDWFRFDLVILEQKLKPNQLVWFSLVLVRFGYFILKKTILFFGVFVL